MRRTFLILCCLPSLCAAQDTAKNFLVKLETGFSVSREAKVSTDPNVWDPAVEGYNAKLKNAGIMGGGFEYIITPWLSTDLVFSYRRGYEYRKPQTPTVAPGGAFYGDSKFRRFDLAISTLMACVNLKGNGIKGWHYRNESCSLYPVISAGIGGSYQKVSNFYAIRNANATTSGLQRASSIGGETQTTSFSYQLGLGAEYQSGPWLFSIGYRWFDPGQFKGPSYLVDDSAGSNSGLVVPPWKINFQAHEFILSFKRIIF